MMHLDRTALALLALTIAIGCPGTAPIPSGEGEGEGEGDVRGGEGEDESCLLGEGGEGEGEGEGEPCAGFSCPFGEECVPTNEAPRQGLCVDASLGVPSCGAGETCAVDETCVQIARGASFCVTNGLAPCTSEGDCDGPLSCDFSLVAQAGTCRVVGGPDAACTRAGGPDADGCAPGLFCGLESGRCLDPCFECRGCSPPQVCTEDYQGGVAGCAQPGEINTVCSGDQDCTDGHCVDERCSLDECGGDVGCAPGLVCNFEQLDCGGGHLRTCIVPAALDAECFSFSSINEECGFLRTPCAEGLSCSATCGDAACCAAP